MSARMCLLAVATVLTGGALAAPVSGAAGPTLVRDIRPNYSSLPANLVAVGNTLFFTAHGAGGRELWKSDGTEAGTIRVKNIRAGSASSNPFYLTDVAGTLFFGATDSNGTGLWTSDGTEPGTDLVGYVSFGPITSFRGKAFFGGVEGELWMSDGTLAGTVPVKDFGDAPIGEMEVVGNRLYIAAGVDGLWVSDGTTDGTNLVDTIPYTPDSAGFHTLTSAGGRLYFLRDKGATDEISPNVTDLWTSDGTASGTARVKNFGNGDDYVQDLVAAQGRLFFTAAGKLWKSSGTATTTQAVASGGGPVVNAGGTVYFLRGDGVWKTNGSTAGTVHVTDATPHENQRCNPHAPCHVVYRDYDPVGVLGQMAFPSETGEGVELWITDASAGGSHLARDIWPGPEGSRPANLMRVGNAIFFTANDSVHGRELWRYAP
ncbi:MAG TPA: ELWxxDGT repeat protein [Candidatus Limnocylindrales bacterium]|nr:ELWxxDGT repeat protein [Candidatus Limnocylindrales bacterium]